MKPRFPKLPAALFVIAAFCILPLLENAVAHMGNPWPVALALAHMLLFILVSAWCANALDRYFDRLSIWKFEQRRISPHAIHITKP